MKCRRCVFLVLVWTVVMIAPVSFAQSKGSDATDTGSVQELRSQLELLRDQMNKLQSRLAELDASKAGKSHRLVGFV